MIKITGPSFGDRICKKCLEENRITTVGKENVAIEGSSELSELQFCRSRDSHNTPGLEESDIVVFNFETLGISETKALLSYCDEFGIDVVQDLEFAGVPMD